MLRAKFFAVAVLSFVAISSYALPWTVFGQHRKPVTLIITANYKSPRLMAEIIQAESRQPYLLLPVKDSADTRIIFCPAKKNGALQIAENRINEFVRWLAPKRIIVLGNENFVPAKYVDMLDKTIPVVRIEGTSWARVADELNFMLNLSNLSGDFRRLSQEMMEQGGIYRPISRPQSKSEVESPAPMTEVPAAAPEAPAAESAEAPLPDFAAPAETPAAN